jgi:hypothetical protein
MVRSADEAEAAFAAVARERAQAVVVQGMFFSKTIADLAIKHRLPAASGLSSFVHCGGPISYGICDGANAPDGAAPSSCTRSSKARGEDLPVLRGCAAPLACACSNCGTALRRRSCVYRLTAQAPAAAPNSIVKTRRQNGRLEKSIDERRLLTPASLVTAMRGKAPPECALLSVQP